MKKLWMPLLVVFLFQSCISKKKTTYSKNNTKELV